jgi:copper chaperone
VTLEFTLPDMSCGHCIRAVSSTVQRVDPAAQVVTDLPARLLRIETSFPRQDFAAALAAEGYPPAP